jgi:hypothetical protein
VRVGALLELFVTYVRPRSPWLVLGIYVLGAVAIGVALPWLRGWAGQHWGRRGLGVAFAVNIAMPVWIVAISAAYPKPWTALVGTFLATLAFVTTGSYLAPLLSGGPWWAPIRGMGPVLVAACLAYHVLAVMAVGAVWPRRRVGRPPDPMCCTVCGYSLKGLPEPRCPECFTSFDQRRVLQAAATADSTLADRSAPESAA